jgi:hypothetical protein
MQKKYIYMSLEVKEKTRLVHTVVEAEEEYKIQRQQRSASTSCRSSPTRISRGSAKGSGGRQLATPPCITTFACTSLL